MSFSIILLNKVKLIHAGHILDEINNKMFGFIIISALKH